MADQKLIKKRAEELSVKLGIAQEEIVDAISQLTRGKTNKEVVSIINDLDINKIIELKRALIMSGYVAVQRDILL